MNESNTFNKVNEIKVPCNILLVAMTNGGKSHYCVHKLLPQLGKQIDRLVIMSPTLELNGDYDHIKADDKSVFKVSKNISDAFEEIIKSQSALFDSYKMGMIKKSQVPQVCVILDDCISERILQGERSVVSKFSIKSRHYRISLVIMTQRINALPRQLRLNCKYFICFSVAGYSELERVMLEYVPKRYHRLFQDKMLDIFSVPFNHLYIDNYERDIRKRMFVNGNEMIDWDSLT